MGGETLKWERETCLNQVSHHVAIQMISSKESRLVRQSPAVPGEESNRASCKWRCKFLPSSCHDKESLFAIDGTVSSL